MLEDFIDEAEVRLLVYQLMLVMWQHGLHEVHIGGLMRMLGIDPDVAAQHDDEFIVLDDKFAKYVDQITRPRAQDQTLH